jgi:hypothetical protein
MRDASGALITAVILLATGALPVQAQPSRSADGQTVRMTRGSISGLVSDETGGPIAGAMVSAFGQTMSSALSDSRGRFSIDGLPAGEYLIQAHLSGFVGSRRELVRVGAGASPVERPLSLRRLDLAVATTGSGAPVPARPIMAAGVRLPSGTLSDQPDATTSADTPRETDHPHTETAWRLRHIKRSILKDSSTVVALVETDNDVPSESTFGRARASATGLASTIFTDLPFSGEVNLLTTSALGPGQLFSGAMIPRPVAYLSIGAPTPAGDWSVRAAMSQGDLSSWLVAGAFASRDRGPHGYEFGLSYSTQEYLGGNLAALAAVTDGSRNAGELYAYDRWTLTPAVSVEYGGRFARYDYLDNRALFSPLIGFSITPLRNTRVTTTIGQQMVAPGAEEFVASDTPGPWLPPERTFAPLGSTSSMGDFRVERARYLDVMLEHQFDETYVLGVRRFYQDVDDQLVTLFGLDMPEGPRSVGHYYVASAGGFTADGWALRVSSPPSKSMRASIDYSITRAQWTSRGDIAAIGVWAPAAIRAEREDVHDVTTSFEGESPETATRVFLLYKINTGFTRANHELARPGLDARFELQVNQALPFGVAGTRWEILVGIRNLFRDSLNVSSAYDELLVVRPPKRVVGGFLVRF